MSDLKTVTFDASQWQLVPKVPTENMVTAGFESSPDKFFSEPHDWEAFENMSGCQQAAHKAKLCYRAMLEHAPTPAAQSAATLSDWQWIELANRHVASDWGCDKPDGFLNAVKALCVDFAAQSAGQEAVARVIERLVLPEGSETTESRQTVQFLRDVPTGTQLYAAPVNGGEREIEAAQTEAYRKGVADGRLEAEQRLRAADAQQVGGEIDLDTLKRAALAATPQDIDTAQIVRDKDGSRYIDCPICCGEGSVMLEGDYCNYDGKAIGVQFYGIGNEFGAAEAYFRVANPAAILSLVERLERAEAALTSPAKVGGDERLTDAAIKVIADRYSSFVSVGVYDETRYDCTEDFYNFCRELIRAALSVNGGERRDAEQVGGDGREAFEAWCKREFPGLEVRVQNLLGTYTKAITEWLHTGWQAHAALSADGGKRKDAERYRLLRDGSQHWCENSRADAIEGVFGEELDRLVDAIAAKAKGE
ncbi:hypothetical protein PEP31012_03565 [Pandoraea eparura]|uniref:Uncharacterized protein n=1 Tax=Pandoraea eparura TaxID=2508291 RepID=A0A5E4WYL6_9BURK|nr:hypothetical protein [Pandoraea eparura]VVE28934.1 hypothetical protein PEP31012_03565 [Pandoraea eparura]